jgi:two-component system, response regulator, stage 0 sporulation protein F
MKKGNNTKIIVVDDDLEINNLIKMALQNEGYDVFGFTSPLSALEYFKINCNVCNLVITDLRMPEMDGLELSKNVKLIDPKTKVLLMTAFETSDDIRFASNKENHIIDDFIQKPITIKKLYTLVDSHLQGNSS